MYYTILFLLDESFARKLQEDYKEECSFGYQNSCTVCNIIVL